MKLTKVKYEPNRGSWTGDEKAVSAAGTGEQLPDVEVPGPFELCVRGHPDNTGYMYIGTTQAQAQAHTIPLSPDDSYLFKINNANLIWVDAAVSGEKVIYAVEQ